MQRLLWEVRTEVAKGTPYVLPLQSIKKLEEIEKLSKAIRARMRLALAIERWVAARIRVSFR